MEWDLIDLRRDFFPGLQTPGEIDRSYHIVVSDGEILAPESGPFRPLDQDEFRWLGVDIVCEHILGHIGGVPLFAAEADPDADEPEGYSFETLFTFLGQVEEPVFNLIGRSKQIVEWHRDHQYCGQCGKPTEASSMDRSRKCHDCEQFFYPRITPSIIVLVTRGEELLLARNARARGRFFSTLAGFVEPGESLEEAVHREVMEEVGITIGNLRYFGSQPWPFPNSLMLGFHADYQSGQFVLQEEEIAEADWFHYTSLPHRPSPVSIAGRLIESYIRELESGRG